MLAERRRSASGPREGVVPSDAFVQSTEPQRTLFSGPPRDAGRNEMFSSAKPVIAMIHVGALPGTPAGGASLRELEARAVAECASYRDAGVHGVALENMHDVPYLRGGVGPEITAAMTVLALAVKGAS